MSERQQPTPEHSSTEAASIGHDHEFEAGIQEGIEIAKVPWVESLAVSEEAKYAASLAMLAGQTLRERVGQLQDRTPKGRTNFKIAVDDEVDGLIRAHIESAYPNDSINSEELEAKETGSETSWYVDPLDGTIPYTLKSSDHSATSIGRARNGVPEMGVINVALKDELLVGELGKGAYLNGERIQASGTDKLNEAVIGVEYGKNNRTQGLDLMRKLLGPDGITYPVTYGGSAATLALVASGRLDGYVSYDIEPWDVAAAVVICQEAGATVTTVDGRPWTVDDSTLLVAGATLHQELLTLA